MKHSWILLLTISLFATCLAEKQDPFTLGKLSLGQKESRVLRILGQPQGKSEVVEEMATGEMVQRWSYPDQGLDIELSRTKEDEPFTVYRMHAKAPCDLAAYKGIRIGAFAVEVKAVARSLGKMEGVEVSQSDRGCGFLWADSYQSLSVTFTGGKVSEIFLGPGPE